MRFRATKGEPERKRRVVSLATLPPQSEAVSRSDRGDLRLKLNYIVATRKSPWLTAIGFYVILTYCCVLLSGQNIVCEVAKSRGKVGFGYRCCAEIGKGDSDGGVGDGRPFIKRSIFFE